MIEKESKQNKKKLDVNKDLFKKKSKSLNLAFDVTPAKFITGLITEKVIFAM